MAHKSSNSREREKRGFLNSYRRHTCHAVFASLPYLMAPERLTMGIQKEQFIVSLIVIIPFFEQFFLIIETAYAFTLLGVPRFSIVLQILARTSWIRQSSP